MPPLPRIPRGSGGAVRRDVEGVGLRVYGHSFVANGGSVVSGTGWWDRLRTRLGLLSATTYGVGSSRWPDIAVDALGGTITGTVAGAGMDGTHRGVVVADCMQNDMYNPADQAASPAANALTAAQQEGVRQAMRLFLACATCASKVEDSAATKSAGWTTSGSQYSGASRAGTTTVGSYVEYTVTVPQSGAVWFTTALLDPAANAGAVNANANITVDGTQHATLQGLFGGYTGRFGAMWSRRRNASVGFASAAVKITGLTPGSRVIRITHAGLVNEWLYADAMLVPHANPVPVILLRDPVPVAGQGASSLDSARAAVCAANKTALDAILDSVAAEFPSARVIDQAPALPAANRSALDGVHPNDKGMLALANLLEPVILGLASSTAIYTTL